MVRLLVPLLNFVGGSLARAAGTGATVGLFFVLYGVLPWEFAVDIMTSPPSWLMSGWLRLAAVLIGLSIIWASIKYNLWSLKQRAIDGLADDLSWAIHNLLNRTPRPETPEQVAQWEADFNQWCNQVSTKLDNKAFFTRADKLHFDRLGFVEPIQMSGQARYDWLLSMLRKKFERLREIIQLTQQRSR